MSGVDYFSHADSAGRYDLWDGGQEAHSDEYLTDLLSQRGVD